MARPFAATWEDLALLALFGTAQSGTGLLLLTIGSRLVSATRASLLANLALPFAPLWVSLAFDEVPSQVTFVGGELSARPCCWTSRRGTGDQTADAVHVIGSDAGVIEVIIARSR